MLWYEPIIQVLGGFDPLKFDRIRNLNFTFAIQPTARLDIDVFVAYGDKHFILFRMCNARHVKVSEIESPLLQLGELFIDSLMGHGLEGLNYRVHDELGAISAYCEDLQILQIVESMPQGNDQILWQGS